ncbi:MAG: FAD-dependent oxidoreductase, partial [Candidatus Bipolaricaulaceae bacterium]
MEWDVAIIGAGPAGLFAARELVPSRLRVIVLEKGQAPRERQSITCGVGGAGAFSDGKLNLSPRIGGEPEALGLGPKEAADLIAYVDEIFTHYGAPGEYSGEDEEALARLKKVAAEA